MRRLASGLLAVLVMTLPAAGWTEPAPAAAQEMTTEQFAQGMDLLKRWLETRGEDREAVDVFMGGISDSMAGDDGDGRVEVSRAAFEAFVRYERAWQRARKDGQPGANVSKAGLQKELKKLDAAKRAFDRIAQTQSPAFFAAFKKAGAASRRFRASRGMGIGGGAGSSVFADTPSAGADAAVDAGVEALAQGDAAGAIASATQAIAQNPKDAEAYALRAAANFDVQNIGAARQDAQTALQLDPDNRQAQAISSMAASAPAAPAARTAADAAAMAGSLARAPAAGPGQTAAKGVLVPSIMELRKVQAAAAQAGTLAPPGPSGGERARLEMPNLWNPKGSPPSPASGARGYEGNRDAPVDASPQDPEAYFARARAFADAGDRAGMLQNLKEAASLDAAYQPFAQAAEELPQDVSLADLFRAGTPWEAARAKRKRRSPSAALILGAAGGFLLVAGLFLFAPGRSKRRGKR